MSFFIKNKNLFRITIPVLAIATFIDLLAGLFLKSMEFYLMIVPGIMILINASIGLRGNIFGAMGSRIGTSMNLNFFDLSFKKDSVVRSNIEAGMGLNLIISLFLGFIGWFFVLIMNEEKMENSIFSIFDFLFVTMFSSLVSGFILSLINILIAFLGYKKGWDIDEINAPLIASMGDTVSIPIVSIFVWIALKLNKLLVFYSTLFLIIVTLFFGFSLIYRKIFEYFSVEAYRIFSHSFPVLCLCLLINMFSGFILDSSIEKLMNIPIFLVIFPAFLNAGNGLAGILTSKISTAIHKGIVRMDNFFNLFVKEQFKRTYFVSFVLFPFLGVIAFCVFLSSENAGLSLINIILIISFLGMISSTFINVVSLFVSILSVKFKLNPDDHSIPVTSTFTDFINTFLIIVTVSFLM